jgi:peptide/nickel transport system ATP-binding protein
LSIKGLKTQFFTRRGLVKALDGVNLDIRRGEMLGIVGETGCGKSVLALSVMGLLRHPGKIVEGSIIFNGSDLTKLAPEEMRKIRGARIAMVFQDPLTFLNPVFTMEDQLSEVYLCHSEMGSRVLAHKIARIKKALNKCSEQNESQKLRDEIAQLEERINNPPKPSSREARSVARDLSLDMLRFVNLPDPERVAKSYPHELSGGMRQRVMIAMALAMEPDILIADEATTALDVTTQAQILRLLKELRTRIDSSIVIITHDLGIVAQTCERVAVMYAGRIVEIAPTMVLFSDPRHPYTEGLLAAVPRISGKQADLKSIRGSVPNLIHPPSGCRFHPRCPYAEKLCEEEKPEMIEVSQEHFVDCHLYGKLQQSSKKDIVNSWQTTRSST